jgi:hypothetical protein
LDSGRLTTKANLATIIQMGIALKKLTTEQTDDEEDKEPSHDDKFQRLA